MKTFNHIISFPLAVGELVVQYNFTEAEPSVSLIPALDKPAEVEITDVYFKNICNHYSFLTPTWFKGDMIIKQAVYEAHMKQLREKENAEAERKDGYQYREPDYPKTSTLHEHAKQMWELGQDTLKKHNPEYKGIYTQMPLPDHIFQLTHLEEPPPDQYEP